MSNTTKLMFLRKKKSLKSKIVSDISDCLTIAVKKEKTSTVKSEITSSVKNALRKAENLKSLDYLVTYDTDSILTKNKIDLTFHLITNPEIERLKKEKTATEHDYWIKEKEVKNLTQRESLTKDLTRNDAIKGLVSSIIEKLKKLSKEEQIEFAKNKKKISLRVEEYIERLIDVYDDEGYWGIDYSNSGSLLGDLSTVKDIAILSANLSKYVHLATSGVHNATQLQLKIAIMERDKLKLELAEINRLLEIEYAKNGEQHGFSGGFGGGGFGGGGADHSF
ncbi:hypothetical protein [Zobellia sp. 1_MG-2023]|uniref:hypothetical protein n=1 Tax=Zobellia sp. 1_MG-2023 TaxID=3062626 RepID=UPI0026E1FF68|nr:hypothetical protein [Zobellia sp. 1_MG-2023]MDO6821227.1 hypothetical protein [Zobellia sp. 1_MG-2023]